jgi:hypothetical protein
LGEHVASIFRVEHGRPRKRPLEATDKFISAKHLLLLASCLAYSSTLKMEVIHSSETSGFLGTARNYNPETVRLIDNELRENGGTESQYSRDYG